MSERAFKPLPVFVSSTFAGLVPCREAVQKVLGAFMLR